MRAGKFDGARGGHVGGGAQCGVVNDKAACDSPQTAVGGHLQHAAAHNGAAAVQVGVRQDERPVVVLDQGARAVQTESMVAVMVSPLRAPVPTRITVS